MIVHLEMLHNRETIRELLRQHGWRLDRTDSETSYSAQHPTVTDQQSARARLNAVGLLTSSSLRIDFVPKAKRTGLTTSDSSGQ
jgi:hypothetical protein